MTRLRKLGFGCVAAVLICGTASSEMRMWRPISGDSFVAEYVREQFDSYYFRDFNKDLLKVSVTNLSSGDVAYLQSLVPPKIRLSVSKKKKPKVRNKDAAALSADDVVDVVTATLTISKISAAPFNGTLQGEIYIVGKEAEADEFKLMHKRTFPVRFPPGKKSSVEVAASTVLRTYPSWNQIEIRGQEYGGYVAVVLDTQGNVLEMESDLSWLTEEKLSAFRNLEVLYWFDEDCKKRTPSRPQHRDPEDK